MENTVERGVILERERRNTGREAGLGIMGKTSLYHQVVFPW